MYAGTSEDQTRDEALLVIIERCKSRLVKHTKVLERMLRCIGSAANQFDTPQNVFLDDKAESLQDIELLGEYCEATHISYMRLCKHRLKQLTELVSKIPLSTTLSDLQDLASLAKLAYHVRRSCSFKHLVAYNISKSKKPDIAVRYLQDVVERIGQISKFNRAAVTLTAFLARIQKVGRGIEIKATPTQKIEVPELAFRKADQVRCRGGQTFTSSGGAQIQNMIDRWPDYREHVELQLIIFYEQNHGSTLFSPYIGCNKRSCYLCYSFIAEHGRFQVAGCHQSLYSLWAVRETITFVDEERWRIFNRALKKVCLDLEQKVQTQKSPYWQRPGFRTHNESVANLSRVSLAVIDRSFGTPFSEKRASGAIAMPVEGGSTAILDEESNVVSSIAELTPVPEESLEEVVEAGVYREPLRSDAVSPDKCVNIAHEIPYSQVEEHAVVPQLGSHTELIAPTASAQADLIATQDLPRTSVDLPVFDASAVDCSGSIFSGVKEPQVFDRPRRKHRRHSHGHHQRRHLRSLQHDPDATLHSNRDVGSTRDRPPATKERGKRPARTSEKRKSQSSWPRITHVRGRERRSSLKEKLIGIINVVFAAFGGQRQKRRHKRRSISRSKRI